MCAPQAKANYPLLTSPSELSGGGYAMTPVQIQLSDSKLNPSKRQGQGLCMATAPGIPSSTTTPTHAPLLHQTGNSPRTGTVPCSHCASRTVRTQQMSANVSLATDTCLPALALLLLPASLMQGALMGSPGAAADTLCFVLSSPPLTPGCLQIPRTQHQMPLSPQSQHMALCQPCPAP